MQTQGIFLCDSLGSLVRPQSTSLGHIVAPVILWRVCLSNVLSGPARLLSNVYFLHMNKEKPTWLEEATTFCRNSGIKIVAWGAHVMVVEAKSEDRAKEIASQPWQLGFKAIHDEGDAYAGLLSLSKKPNG